MVKKISKDKTISVSDLRSCDNCGKNNRKWRIFYKRKYLCKKCYEENTTRA